MAAAYLLDTNILSAVLRGSPASLLNRMAKIAPNRLCLSSVVLAELRVGAEKGERKAATLAALGEIAEGMTPLPFDADDAVIYGRIRAAMARKGAGIGPMDMLMAAQAVARGLVLVTDNEREFKRVPGLHWENWLK